MLVIVDTNRVDTFAVSNWLSPVFANPADVDNNCRVVARLALPDHNAPPSAGCGDHILITK
jgi:hypothetical protein